MKSTEIVFIIDKSGSMSHLVGDTIGGFNGFIESQKDDTKTTLTTVLFDSTWRILHDRIDVYEVKPMTNKDYMAYGGTAMLDAIGARSMTKMKENVWLKSALTPTYEGYIYDSVDVPATIKELKLKSDGSYSISFNKVDDFYF